MNNDVFEIIVLATKIILSLVSVLVAPKVIAYLQANTTEKQRTDAEFWTKRAILLFEDIYKDKGKGMLKKDDVLAWLAKNKINITAGQADILIDIIVKEWNKKGWPI